MNAQDKILRFRQGGSNCEDCRLSQFCLAREMSLEDKARLSGITRQSRPIDRGKALFRAGEELAHLYLIKSGSMKIFSTTEDGLEQIIRFQLPGDIIGLDAMEHDTHRSTAVALETSSLCMLPWPSIEDALKRLPGLYKQLLRIVGKEIATENERIVLLGQRSARERLAAFLLHLSAQFSARGFSALEFNLSMSRQEIANYLALAIETVSRLFSAFQSEGLIHIERRFVRLERLDDLRSIADAEPVSIAS